MVRLATVEQDLGSNRILCFVYFKQKVREAKGGESRLLELIEAHLRDYQEMLYLFLTNYR